MADRPFKPGRSRPTDDKPNRPSRGGGSQRPPEDPPRPPPCPFKVSDPVRWSKMPTTRFGWVHKLLTDARGDVLLVRIQHHRKSDGWHPGAPNMKDDVNFQELELDPNPALWDQR